MQPLDCSLPRSKVRHTMYIGRVFRNFTTVIGRGLSLEAWNHSLLKVEREQCNYVISQNETYNVTTEELQEKCTSWIYNDTYFENTLTSE
ncbi:hypothetical protein Avbf_17120, partial [Armadillidium vulgare]